jgi:hypothetical protein
LTSIGIDILGVMSTTHISTAPSLIIRILIAYITHKQPHLAIPPLEMAPRKAQHSFRRLRVSSHRPDVFLRNITNRLVADPTIIISNAFLVIGQEYTTYST